MKILVIQLARLGDIFQSWPALRAMKRTYPDAKIDLVVRSKFKGAAEPCDSVDRIIEFNSQDLIRSCFSDQEKEISYEDSIDGLDDFLDQLDGHYDQIINLSYSPMSSYLNLLLQDRSQDIRGFSRFSDAYLSLPDEASSYFYAQVGPGKTNRIHLTDIFSATAGLVLEAIDFRAPDGIQFEKPEGHKSLVIHVGASEKAKSCPPETWAKIISDVTKVWPGQIHLIGTQEESLADKFDLADQVIDLCGQTSLSEVFELIYASEGLIACDSMAIQVANLCQIPVVNLSHHSVSHWETGPRMASSRIIKFSDPDRIQASEIACLVKEMMTGTYLFQNAYCIAESYNHEGIMGPSSEKENFQWNLTKALYFEASFPVIDKMSTYKAFNKIFELSQLGLEQVNNIRRNDKVDVAAGILSHIDEMMDSIGRIEKPVSPLVRWFNTEKLRIGPNSLDKIIDQTEKLFQTLEIICRHYVVSEDKQNIESQPKSLPSAEL